MDFNSRLRLAVQRARESNMPMENIERAIKRVTGSDGTVTDMEEIVYEGYGPGGVAILLDVVTENRNRAAADVRSTLTRNGGNLGQAGCVSWLFTLKGVVTLEVSEEQVEEIALRAIDAGANDFSVEEDRLEVYCLPNELESLRAVLEKTTTVKNTELSQVPASTIPLDTKMAGQTLRLLDLLEELDDVQRVYTNADFPQEALDQYRVGM